MALKLFALFDALEHKRTDLFFPDKLSAKKHRLTLNTAEPDRYVVTYGPDHRKYVAPGQKRAR